MPSTAASRATVRRVLVVEDDQAICGLMTDILEHAGLETLCARTDREAYSLLAAAAFSALLVDVNLGAGTTGFDIARFARNANPDVAVIYVTGEASETSFRAFGVPDSDFLAKPFTANDLRQAVHARLPAKG